MAVLKGGDSREVGENSLGGQGTPFPKPRPCPDGEGGRTLDSKKMALALGGQDKGGTVETKMDKDE